MLFVKTCCAVFGFPLACRYFRNNWMSRKEHWACHITQKCFTGGLIASSFAESSGSAQGRWFQQPRHTLVQVFMTCFEKEDHDIKMEQELLASVLMASTHGVPSDPPLVAECRAKYSQYVTELVLIEAIESKNYTAFIAPVSLQTAGTIFNGDMSAEVVMNIKVKRNICTEKDRTVVVRMQGSVVTKVDSCECPAILNCGHICRHVFSACVLLCTQFSSRITFSQLEHFINKRYLLKKEVQFLGVGAAGSLPQTNIHPSEECIGGPGQQIDYDDGIADDVCDAEHFASQITSTAPQHKGSRLSHISFDKLRAECTPICQIGSRNNKVGNALMQIFKTLHDAVIGMTPEEQNNATPQSLLFRCQEHLQGGPISLSLCTERTADTQATTTPHTLPAQSSLAVVGADHRGKMLLSF